MNRLELHVEKPGPNERRQSVRGVNIFFEIPRRAFKGDGEAARTSRFQSAAANPVLTLAHFTGSLSARARPA